MPKITAEIKKALSSLIEQEGSALELSRKTGISHSTFSKYMSGQIQKINQAPLQHFLYFFFKKHKKIARRLKRAKFSADYSAVSVFCSARYFQ